MGESAFARAFRYEADVLAGRIAVGELTRLAVERSIRDRERTDWEWVLREEEAERSVRFLEKLEFTYADFKGKPFRLSDWQVWVEVNAHGWVHRERVRVRRFRWVYLEVARKNGKSEWMGGKALYLVAADGEHTPEVYIAGVSEEQSGIVYKRANLMMDQKAALRDHYELKAYGSEFSKQRIICGRSKGFIRPLAWTPEKLDGHHIHAAILDELHAHPTDKMFAVCDTATSARRQSMIWTITTAGDDISGICYRRRRLLERILRGKAEGERVFGCIWHLDWEADASKRKKGKKGDNWADERNWQKPNPNLGVSVTIEDLRAKADAAKALSTELPAFLTKHLNVWLRGANAWLKAGLFDSCMGDIDIADFEGQACWMGIDLADTKDICSLCYLFKREDEGREKYYLFWRNYLPQLTVDVSSVDSMGGWVEDGHVIAVPGAVLPYSEIEDQIDRDATRFDLRMVGFDPWKAKQLIANLNANMGWLKLVEVRQTGYVLSDPMRAFESALVAGSIVWDGNPAVGWMFSNVITVPLPNDNIRPDKPDPESRIDAAAAALIAYCVAIQDVDDRGPVQSFLDEGEAPSKLDGDDW